MIEAAKNGADICKFQTFSTDDLTKKTKKDKYQINKSYKKAALNVKEIRTKKETFYKYKRNFY